MDDNTPCEYVNVWLNEQIKKMSNVKYNYANIWLREDLTNCNTANKCADLYKSKVSRCNSTNPTPFCKGLKSFKERYNVDIKVENSCKEIKNKFLTYPGEKNTKTQLERTREARILQANHASRREDLGQVGATGPNSKHYSIIIPVSVILLVPFLFLIFYKFIPFGSFLPPWIQKKNKICHTEYEHDEHLLHDYENEETVTQNIRHNIQYQSS
ncbi:PIR Superfamily Protein [Plasmodium ovale curtisi]|uniref:PIR Superfamily Protein n=1 Tax=Plasmodium ovale curtisi TaxID=864141 RepID=A0A1A8XC75_PLAOA|nr:PIR Superfamily Protein [Plasmodium ovale curtisi]